MLDNGSKVYKIFNLAENEYWDRLYESKRAAECSLTNHLKSWYTRYNKVTRDQYEVHAFILKLEKVD